MFSLRFSIAFLSFLFFGVDALAQTKVTISTSTSNYRLDGNGFYMSLRNCTDQDSERMSARFWVSLDNVFDDSDVNTRLEDVVVPKRPRIGTCGGKSLFAGFKLPLPDREVPDGQGLPGGSLVPHEWLGKKIYFRGCLTVLGTGETKCTSAPLDPPRFRTVISPSPKLVTTGQVGDSRSVEMLWEVPLKDNGVELESHYRMVYNEDTSPSVFNANIVAKDSLEVVEKDGKPHFRYVFEGITPGVKARFYPDACIELEGNPECYGNQGSVAGLVYGDFYATEGGASEGAKNGAIRVFWEEFASAAYVKGYVIKRCEAGFVAPPGSGGKPGGENESNCIEFDQAGPDTNFDDTTAENGKLYRYTIFPCLWRRDTGECAYRYYDNPSGQYSRGSGTTNLGYRPFPDDYEPDNSATRASLVKRSVVQLRSFDEPEDEDWIKIELKSSQSIIIQTSGPTSEDTTVTLFDSELKQIDFSANTQGIETSFATLVSDKLSAGTYYVKVTQPNGDDVVLPPRIVPVYWLSVEISNQSMDFLPAIIELLMSD